MRMLPVDMALNSSNMDCIINYFEYTIKTLKDPMRQIVTEKHNPIKTIWLCLTQHDNMISASAMVDIALRLMQVFLGG